jgi:Flp pilus assembly protein TadG
MKIHKEESANALVEFALIMPVFTALLLGVLNYGVALQKTGVLADSARAGAESALLQTCSPNLGCYTNTSKMQTVATAAVASAGITNYTAVATNYCTCSPGSGTTVTCGTYCSNYGLAAMYAQVTVSGTVPLLFNHQSGRAITSVARVRISCPSC